MLEDKEEGKWDSKENNSNKGCFIEQITDTGNWILILLENSGVCATECASEFSHSGIKEAGVFIKLLIP